jgi:hypothetical protein
MCVGGRTILKGIFLERRAWGCGLDSPVWGLSQVVGYCEHGVECWDRWKASLSEWLMDTQRIVTLRVDWLDMKRRNRDDCICESFTNNRRFAHYYNCCNLVTFKLITFVLRQTVRCVLSVSEMKSYLRMKVIIRRAVFDCRTVANRKQFYHSFGYSSGVVWTLSLESVCVNVCVMVRNWWGAYKEAL